jgi:hypothetical protein
MAHNLKALLTMAAEMRASGMSWASVANRVQRKVGTCSKWPSQYRPEWSAILLGPEEPLRRSAELTSRAARR